MDIHIKNYIKEINTGSNKTHNINNLGNYLSDHLGSKDIVIDSVNRIVSRIYQIRILSIYFSYFFYNNKSNWELTKSSVEKIIKELYPQDDGESICQLYILLSSQELIEDKATVIILKEAAVCVKNITNHNVRSDLSIQIAVSLKRKIALNDLLDIIQSFEDERFDSMSHQVYNVITRPESSIYYDNLELAEVYNRNANDWILWILLIDKNSGLDKDPFLKFRFILHISRFSDINADIKIQFLDQYLFPYSSYVGQSQDILSKLGDINSSFPHSEIWKERIGEKLSTLI